MPRADSSRPAAPLFLICGEDEFAVQQRTRRLYGEWTEEVGGADHEIIDAAVTNSGEAIKAISRLQEALQTLPFFGSGKVIWFKNCSFLGDERAADTQAVTDSLAALAQELKDFSWGNVRLLISAGKVDKRKTFFKTLDKLGTVETLNGWSAETRDWATQAQAWVLQAIRERGKAIARDAAAELVERVGPNARQLDSELEKLALYAEGPIVEREDVEAVCVRNKTARAFALGEALGNRDLPELLRRLDEELWDQASSQKSGIRVLYGLISKIRALLLLKEMLREGWVQPTGSFPGFKGQLERVPVARLPADRRYNPLTINAYVLFKALGQAGRYTEAELIRAMELLLECNLRLVTSALDETLVLQQALVQIVGEAGPSAGRAG